MICGGLAHQFNAHALSRMNFKTAIVWQIFHEIATIFFRRDLHTYHCQQWQYHNNESVNVFIAPFRVIELSALAEDNVYFYSL